MNAINMNYSKWAEHPMSPEGYGKAEQSVPEKTISDVVNNIEEMTQVIEKNLMSLESRISPIMRSVTSVNGGERVERDQSISLKPRMQDLLEKLSVIASTIQNMEDKVEL